MAANTPIPRGTYERLARKFLADEQRKQFLEQMQAARNAEDAARRHSVGPDTRRQAHPDLISNALLAGTLGGAMSAAGLPSVGLRAGLIGGGATDAVLNAGDPEGGAELSGALAAAGALGRHSIPAAIAALGASSSEAAGMPFHSWMKRLNSLNRVEPTAMHVNPSRAELLSMLKDARETYPTSPTVRLLRDQRNNDVYGVEGSSILHDDMRRQLGMPYEASPGVQGSTLPDLESELRFLQSLPIRKAGGGAIKRLSRRAMSAFDDLRPSTVAPQGALSVVKPKGGNWLAGSVEDALSNLVRRGHNGEAPIPGTKTEALNNWIEGPLTKYVKTRMASPDDEVRKLAEQGVLHFEPAAASSLSANVSQHLARSHGSFPTAGPTTELGSLARGWENASDAVVGTAPIRDFLPIADSTTPESLESMLRKAGGEYAVKNPDQLTHGWNRGFTTGNLGFNHLIDELSNALNPNSGLPPHLQLTPEAVKQMSMEKAVRRVADINAHRAAVQAAANAELANKAMVVREYTDPSLPNPKGLRWVELKAPETSWKEGDPIPEGFSLSAGRKPGTFIANHSGALESSGTHPSAEAAVNTILRKRTLQDQLKYEGDTMGHCVGGYCPDVLEGRSRIFSLRDAKGEPHVTVEVQPPQQRNANEWYAWQKQNPEEYTKLNAEFGEDMDAKLKAAAERYKHPASIVQIKGKQNRKPNDEYLPFVQDFVRNSPLGSPWGDVGDLQNTGLRRVEDAFNKNELAKLRAANIPVPEGYATSADIEELHKQFNLLTTGTEFNPARAWERMQYDSHIDDLDIDLPDRAAPMAAGGTVTKRPSPEQFQGIIAALEQELANAN